MTETRHGDWTSAWIRGGEISQAVWVDTQVLVWCSGVHLVFYDVERNRETVYLCSEADGVCSIAGKVSLQILAFAERCSRPRILVYKYPEMKLLAKCQEGTELAYLSTAFAADYLVSLTSSPTYSLVIWAWRTGEKLYETETPIRDFKSQMIRVSESPSISIAQLGDSGKLFVWKLISGSKIVMTEEEVILPSKTVPVYVDWSPDAELAIVDRHGHVYISNKAGINRVVLSQHCGICSVYEVPSVCWFQGGLMLKTTFCQMRLYKKNQQNVWQRQQYLKSNLKPHILLSHPADSQKLFYFTTEGYLMQLDLNDKELTTHVKLYYGGIYQFVDLIYPWGHHAALIDNNRLSIISLTDGSAVGSLTLEISGLVTNLKSHPDFPLVAMTSDAGELVLVAVPIPDRPSLLFKYHLQRQRLDLIKFSACGRHVVAAEASGNCFCVSIGENPSNVACLKINQRVIDINCFADKVTGDIKIIALILTSSQAETGHCLMIHRVPGGFEELIELPKSYQALNFVGNELKLIATPYLSREINVFRLEGSRLCLVDFLVTEHQLRHLKLDGNRFCVTAAGSDGMITIFSEQDYSKYIILLSHHRKDLGVSRAICSVSVDSVIALGRDGSLVCLKSPVTSSYKTKNNTNFDDYFSLNPGIYQLLSQEGIKIPVDSNQTWEEWNSEREKLKEELECRERKIEIKSELMELKNKIQKMLDENQNSKEIERLPIGSFDLARFPREQKIKAGKEEREDLRLKFKFECDAMDKVSKWIKMNFWDPHKVKPKSVFSFSDTEITNYPSIEDPADEGVLEWIDELEESVKMNVNTRINSVGRESKHYSLVKSTYKSSKDEKSVIESLMIDDDELEDQELRLREERATQGTTTYRFIQTHFQHSQFDNYCLEEFSFVNKCLLQDIRRLEDYFNDMFGKIFDDKRKVVSKIEELKGKLKFISTEMKLMFDKTLLVDDFEYQWRGEENPESVIRLGGLEEVRSEVGMDEDKQEYVNVNADAEAERIRLKELTDEFREKTMAMMDGVDMRWEDLFIKEITRPRCMEVKSPEQYDVQDVLAVEKYEKQVFELNFQREKYRRILENDFQNTAKAMKETISDFNKRCHDFFEVKIKIDAAICQINLLRYRGFISFAKKFQMQDEIQRIEKLIDDKKAAIETIFENNSKLQKFIFELKDKRRIIEDEEKNFLEKARKELVGKYGKLIFEALKKYLKSQFPARASANDLRELGKCVRGEKFEYLFEDDCVDYLKRIELMEEPEDLPEFISPEHWNYFVGFKRKKVEIELRLRANSIEISEIEVGVSNNKIKVRRLEEDVGKLEDKVRRLRDKLIEFDLDIEIQLVMEMRQVEIDLCASREDAKNSDLIPRKRVEEVIKKVIAAAEYKLKILQKVTSFNRGLVMKEWEHKVLRMRMDDFFSELRDVKTFVVTKDTRVLLRRMFEGLKDDKTPQQLARELAAIKNTHDKFLKQALVRVREIEAKVQAVRKDNQRLDKKITQMNAGKLELESTGNLESGSRPEKFHDQRIKILMKRSRLIRNILREYSELVELKNEYEVQCQKTIPFFNLKNKK
ncbi:cilia- and flagella-associated protein 43-like [Microplitis mediator]|uniref:cilia- and flagella-associated protein 43-like n=1 Tax=Microplitis mediator TaxID=375433 RepID=UPI00255453FD|nr:cilia- and flagella-associated protein 43-like [Microplitis mediator]